MFFRILKKEHLDDLVKGLASEYEVVGPVAKGPAFVFAPVTNASELTMDYPTTIVPPKKYLLSPKEQLMRYNSKTGDVYGDEPTITPRVLFGVHPCDINAILMTDKIFLGDYEDPYYKARREATLIIGVSCMPTPACMCNALGTGEVHQGFDLFLTDIGDSYFVSCRSVEGARMLDHFVETEDVTPAHTEAFQTRTHRYKAAFSDPPEMLQIPLLFDAKYDDKMWEEIGDDCLSCGACSMVCPTCYCFDVSDELDADGVEGGRMRTWDSCLSSEFAEVAGGHNFRKTRASRVRYRFYHKMWAYPSKFGQMLCVGCGRCNKACKVNINPRRIIDRLQEGGE